MSIMLGVRECNGKIHEWGANFKFTCLVLWGLVRYQDTLYLAFLMLVYNVYFALYLKKAIAGIIFSLFFILLLVSLTDLSMLLLE